MYLQRRCAVFALVLLLSACSSDASSPTNQHQPDDISNVIYVGGVTDEALVRLLDVSAKVDARQALTVDAPDLSVPVARDTPATFQFHNASEASRGPGLQPRSIRPPASLWQRSLHEAVQFLSPERIAHAHGTPYNGSAYYLVFSDAASKQVLQVFTTGTSFTPESVDWQHLVDAPQPLKLSITSALFDENDIPAGGGPFVGGTFPFRIE